MQIPSFFANPVVGLVGTMASVVSVVLAVTIWLFPQDQPDLVYTVHPARIVLAQPKSAGDLKVTFRGEAIANEVVAIQLAVWNQGRQSIRSSSILAPIEIRLQSMRILEARISKASRQVAKIQLSDDPTILREGRLPLNFSILERGDGANIQIIYVGSPEAHLEMVGTIEHQGNPRNLLPRLKVSAPSEQYRKARLERTVLLWFAIALVVVSLGMGVWVVRLRQRASIHQGRYVLEGAAATTLALALVLLALTLRDWMEPVPPFGF